MSDHDSNNPPDNLFDAIPLETFDPKPAPNEHKRSNKRQELTAAEVLKGKARLAELVDLAFDTLEEALRNAEHNVAARTAIGILDRTGYGPKSTVDVNTTHTDLTKLSNQQLAERAAHLAGLLKNRAEGKTPSGEPIELSKPVVN